MNFSHWARIIRIEMYSRPSSNIICLHLIFFIVAFSWHGRMALLHIINREIFERKQMILQNAFHTFWTAIKYFQQINMALSCIWSLMPKSKINFMDKRWTCIYFSINITFHTSYVSTQNSIKNAMNYIVWYKKIFYSIFSLG